MKNGCWQTIPYRGNPLTLFERFLQEPFPFLLDSGLDIFDLGRYTFFGCCPFLKVSSSGKEAKVQEGGSREKTVATTPLEYLKGKLAQFRVSPIPDVPWPFLGGAVGYWGYDFGFSLLGLQSRRHDELGIPDGLWGFYDTIVIFDHRTSHVTVLSTGFPERKRGLRALRAKERLKETVHLLREAEGGRPFSSYRPLSREGGLKSNFSASGYEEAVRQAKEYIRNGDIYQVNLSQRFSFSSPESSWKVYLRLRQTSPSPFGAFLDYGDFQILSASPERFLKLESDIVTTRPMKGTRPRGENPQDQVRNTRELLASPKDKAELIMIADLERNDLGRVCSYGSVEVTSLRTLEVHPTVLQTTATVKGKLHPYQDRLDLLRACFPGGSITGCPKIRSMQIIDELEPCRRSIYTGSLGYLSFHGDMDLNIIIRTLWKVGSEFYLQVGAGIVADSDPGGEYEETLVKGRALAEALCPGASYVTTQ